MNRGVELHDSDESDSDFCPEKETGIEVSEEESSDVSSGSDDEEKSEEKPQGKRQTKNSDVSKKPQSKKLKSRKRASAQDKAARRTTTSESDDESAPAETERKRTTRQTDAEAKRLSSGREKDELESDEEDKSRSDALWADFLSDVKPKATETKTAKQPKGSSNSATATNGKPTAANNVENGHTSPKNTSKGESTSSAATKEKPTEAKALAQEKIKVTEIVDFAGEEVRVEKVVNADSVKENKATTTLQQNAAGSSTARAAGLKRPMLVGGSGIGSGGGGGLGSILNQIGKKKKISVLEKSQLDWKSFKQNEGIEEELQTFNKGKDGYLERQDFLQRTDLRQFEIEKNLRQSRRNN